VAVLIPSIDLMGGKIVQLVRGDKKALESEDFDYWIARFSTHPLVQLIDLDAAMRTNQGGNQELIKMVCARLPCQVGGGIGSVEQARELLAWGARRVIFGSAMLKDEKINTALAAECCTALGRDQLTFAVDSRGGRVAIQGWKQNTAVDPLEMMRSLEPWCSAFLYTHIDTEGTMTGFPIEVAQQLRTKTKNRLMLAGGIRSMQEVEALDRLGADAVVGMAVYTGVIGK
jgi:phosphoribosylformimino-5-aminoimidazole carboxamide ribotide isomerase